MYYSTGTTARVMEWRAAGLRGDVARDVLRGQRDGGADGGRLGRRARRAGGAAHARAVRGQGQSVQRRGRRPTLRAAHCHHFGRR